MLRMFGLAKAKTTDLSTEFSIDADIDDNLYQGEYHTSAELKSKSLTEIQFAHDLITKRIELVSKQHPNCLVSISIKGMLDGVEVNCKFAGIDAYRQYLQEKHLISAPSLFRI